MMNNFTIVDKANARPPFVQFEARSEEDVPESKKNGHFTAKIVNYALITPLGSKDVIEKIAEPWIADLHDKASRGEYNGEHADFIDNRFKKWKEGMETDPSIGLSVREWASVNRGQAEMLIRANIFTVEDLAGANEQALQNIGMGSRDLREKARAWLDSAKDVGVHAEKVRLLEMRLAQSEERNERLAEAIEELKQQIPRGPGRPRKES